MPDMTGRYGRTKMETVRRDFDALRKAIRSHNSEETEEAWERCERWIGLWPMKGEEDA